MSLTLARRGRGLLLFLSAASYIAWFAGLGDRIEAETGQETTTSVFALVGATKPPDVGAVIARDPFAGGPAPVSSLPPNGEGRATLTPPFSHRTVADLGGYAVPNIDSDGADARSELDVRATIVGPNAVAYVENGAVMDIVRVGDSLGNERVAKIDLRGITFADGTRLDLPDGYAATPAPSRRSESTILSQLQGLRKLLSRRGTATAAPLPIPVPQIPSPAATYPTPAPLPTANARGIPVGVNPTSDPNAPTPYPYPYPYAPPR